MAVIADRPTIEGEAGGNVVLVASDTPLDSAKVEAAIAAWGEGASTAVLTFIAPVDQLLGR